MRHLIGEGGDISSRSQSCHPQFPQRGAAGVWQGDFGPSAGSGFVYADLEAHGFGRDWRCRTKVPRSLRYLSRFLLHAVASGHFDLSRIHEKEPDNPKGVISTWAEID
jgi:hypothetical protein